MNKLIFSISLSLLLLAFPTRAAIITVAADNADNYNNQWQGNGGYGFEQWHFITDQVGGNAGGFLANKTNNSDLNHVASSPNNKA